MFLSQKLLLFDNNKYTGSIRMVYEDILCMEKVINIVLGKLTGM